jgi:hypothetical protein
MTRSKREISTRESDRTRSAKNARCLGTTRAGKPCPATGTVDGYCYWHSPKISEAAKNAARERGRRNGAKARLPLKFTPADFATEAGARKVLEETADFVRSGKIPNSTAQTIAKLAGVAARLAEMKAAEEIARLEREIAAKTKGRR